MREKENKTDQHNKLVQQKRRKRKQNDIVCTFYKQNMTMKKTAKQHRVQKDKFLFV